MLDESRAVLPRGAERMLQAYAKLGEATQVSAGAAEVSVKGWLTAGAPFDAVIEATEGPQRPVCTATVNGAELSPNESVATTVNR